MKDPSLFLLEILKFFTPVFIYFLKVGRGGGDLVDVAAVDLLRFVLLLLFDFQFEFDL